MAIKILLSLFSLIMCLSVTPVYAETYNSDVPSPILGVALGDDEGETVNGISQSIGREPDLDYLDYTYYDRGLHMGGSEWAHVYRWVFDGKKGLNPTFHLSYSSEYVEIHTRKGKVCYIEVNNVICTTSTGVKMGDTAVNFMNSFSESPYQYRNSGKFGIITYLNNRDDGGKYEIPYRKTEVRVNLEDGRVYKMYSWSNETFIGENYYTSREEQLGSSNHSRDGIYKSEVSG